jgi:hypothetical protein
MLILSHFGRHVLKLAEFFLDFPCAFPVLNIVLEALVFSLTPDSFL